MRQTERSASIDILKALATFAVPFVHGVLLVPFSPSAFDLRIADNLIGIITLALHGSVPIFVFLWAYLLEKSILKKGNSDPMQRFYQLFVPFLFWSLLFFLINADFKTLTFVGFFTKHWTGYGWAGQYFLILMFQFLLFFPLVSRLSRKLIHFIPHLYAAFLVFYLLLGYSGWFEIGIVAKINERLFIYWLPYVIFGILHAHKNIFRYVLPVWPSLFVIGLVPLEVAYLHPQHANEFILPSVYVANMLVLGAFMKKQISYKQLPAFLGYVVNILARNTLAILCVSGLVILLMKPVVSALGLHFQFPGGVLIVPFVSGIFTTTISILIAEGFKRLRLGILVAN
ncbi:MAG: acyltransferase family protein [Bacteroidota bacterium]